MTIPTRMVLQAMLDEPAQEMYGLQIGRKAGLPSGTIHPILARFEGCGWLESRWEDIDPGKEGRPRRRYYRLKPDKIAHVRTALDRGPARGALSRLALGFAGDQSTATAEGLMDACAPSSPFTEGLMDACAPCASVPAVPTGEERRSVSAATASVTVLG
ncbi:MAG: PadR family transcriptional regulator, partial [Pseudonocardiaceae bacterium]